MQPKMREKKAYHIILTRFHFRHASQPPKLNRRIDSASIPPVDAPSECIVTCARSPISMGPPLPPSCDPRGNIVSGRRGPRRRRRLRRRRRRGSVPFRSRVFRASSDRYYWSSISPDGARWLPQNTTNGPHTVNIRSVRRGRVTNADKSVAKLTWINVAEHGRRSDGGRTSYSTRRFRWVESRHRESRTPPFSAYPFAFANPLRRPVDGSRSFYRTAKGTQIILRNRSTLGRPLILIT